MHKIKFLAAAALLVLAVSCSPSGKRIKPTKNVIFMLTDGTSTGALAAARWYQRYMTGDSGFNLSLDPYVCGLVQTHESDCPITCSAPGMSAYMTGVLARQGNVSIHPLPHPGQDIYPTDPGKAFQPAATLLEAARYWQGKSTGLVCTVSFTHATPAAASAHHEYRWNNHELALQQACEGLDLVFGSGIGDLTDEIRGMIADTGATLFEDDPEGFRSFRSGRVWALFGKSMMEYEIDRSGSGQPSLSEMTAKAIELLSSNKKGFFLMVEGSKVDYAAHSEDPVGLITELLEFDRAVKVATDFAKKDGNTTVVIIPDHGNCGIQIGGGGYNDYETNPVDSIYEGIRNCRSSAWKMLSRIQGCPEQDIPSVFKEWTGITLRPQELEDIKKYMYVTEDNYMKVSDTWNLLSVVAHIFTSRTHLNIIGGDHTGEDVFFGVYNPHGQRPEGIIRNVDINAYLCEVMGLERPLYELTCELFSPHDVVFEGSESSITKEDGCRCLSVHGRNGVSLRIPAFHNVVYRTKEDGCTDTLRTRAQCVYATGNKRFYLDRSLGELVK